jgi:hypothetical protein
VSATADFLFQPIRCITCCTPSQCRRSRYYEEIEGLRVSLPAEMDEEASCKVTRVEPDSEDLLVSLDLISDLPDEMLHIII